MVDDMLEQMVVRSPRGKKDPGSELRWLRNRLDMRRREKQGSMVEPSGSSACKLGDEHRQMIATIAPIPKHKVRPSHARN